MSLEFFFVQHTLACSIISPFGLKISILVYEVTGYIKYCVHKYKIPYLNLITNIKKRQSSLTIQMVNSKSTEGRKSDHTSQDAGDKQVERWKGEEKGGRNVEAWRFLTRPRSSVR